MADPPVVGVSTVPGRDIEHSIAAEVNPVTVVVELRPVHGRDDTFGAGVRYIGIIGGDLLLGDSATASR